MEPKRADQMPGSHLHFGHWVIALVLSGLLIGVSLAVVVHLKPAAVTPSSTEVVMAIRSVRRAAPASQLENANRPDINESIQAPPVKPKQVVKPKPEQKPKPKPDPKPQVTPKVEPKAKPKPKVAPESESEPVPREAAKPPAPVQPSVTQSPQPTPSVAASLQGKPAVAPVVPELSSAERNAYASRVAQQISRAKRYPLRAQRQGIEGVASLRFEIDSNGNVLKKMIEESSGAAILDQAALNVVDRAGPFEPPPQGFGTPPHVFRIPIAFEMR